MKFYLSILIVYSLLLSMVFAVPIEKRGKVLEALGITGVQNGFATFFHPQSEGGPQGSCGPKENDNSEIVAMNLKQYGDENKPSSHCGKEVFIRSGSKFTRAKVNDACPGCKDKSLDLTPSLFRKLANEDKGVVPIQWCFVDDDECKKIMKGAK
ncbi:unnamed protein product [Cunninghamella blakesleeana]